MTKKILMVDDDPAMVQLVTGVLTRAGYIVETASTGEQAMEKLRTDTYGVVGLDIELPGMDGYEVARRLRRDEGRNQHTPIIMITATTDHEAIDRGFEAGAMMFLKKPFIAAVLRSIVESAIG
jgi:DNA-binding response OmpR family regulator